MNENLKNKVKVRLFKYKLCIRYLNGEKFKNICNELVDLGYLNESLRYKGQVTYNAFIVLYNFFTSFRIQGILSLIDSRGRIPSYPTDGFTEDEIEKQREIKREQILQILTQEELLDIANVQQGLLKNQVPDAKLVDITNNLSSAELLKIIEDQHTLIINNIPKADATYIIECKNDRTRKIKAKRLKEKDKRKQRKIAQIRKNAM